MKHLIRDLIEIANGDVTKSEQATLYYAAEWLEALEKCCTERGAKMQMMWEWMNYSTTKTDLDKEKWFIDYFLMSHPEAKDWFDENGVAR